MMQEMIIEALRQIGIEARRDASAVGVWVGDSERPEKICALGVRIRRGVSMHGLALNVSTDLSYFNLIVPCGICNRGVTSIQKVLGERVPTMEVVKNTVSQAFSKYI